VTSGAGETGTTWGFSARSLPGSGSSI